MSEYGEEQDSLEFRDGKCITERRRFKSCNGCRQRDTKRRGEGKHVICKGIE